ncbi:MAG: cytochrome c-type biogenesis protein [Myxococcota bacterium]
MRACVLFAFVLASLPISAGAQKQEVKVERTDDRAIELGRKIRCPVCQGMPISESPSKSAQDMMTQLRRLVDEGLSDEEIIAWFSDRYGEWAILEPSREGFNLVVWVLPLVALVAGLALWRVNIGGKSKAAAQDDDHHDEEDSDDDEPDDPYLKALRDEVSA